MQQHPREAIVATAQAELSMAVAAIVDKHKVTLGELHRIINDVQSHWIKQQIREERSAKGAVAPGGVAP